MQYKILISAPYMLRDFARLRPLFKRANVKIDLAEVKERLEEKELLKIINQYHGIICGDDRITPAVIDKAVNLKVIVKWGTGIDSIDADYARKKGVPVYNTLDAFTEPVGDTVLAFMLSFSRNTFVLDRMMKKNKWKKVESHALNEKTLGIIGLGNTGRAVARRAKAFGMKILGNDIANISSKILKEHCIRHVDKATLFKEADYITLNCTLTDTAYHLLTKDVFKQMKKSAVVINASRGPVISEPDLVEALEKGEIAGAALDVFEDEPLPKASALRKFDNVILSPHNANSSPFYWQKVHENSVAKLLAGLGL
jgi:D-3-phosphoglycerate dehydrogenase / 2-oxoglutarate reductase